MGKFETFKEEDETWDSYIERFEMYVAANAVQDGVKKAHLISFMGAKTYTLLKSLAAPTLPSEMDYDDIKSKLREHLSPTPSKIAERFRFHKRDQLRSETINEYVVQLKKFSKDCSFGDKLNEVLLDRLVAGIKNEEIQKHLLAEPDTLTFDQAIKKAVAMELAAKDANELSNQVEQINFMSKKNDGKQKKEEVVKQCVICGRKHIGRCRFADASCYKCGKTGHISRVCVSMKNIGTNKMSSQGQSRNNNSNTKGFYNKGINSMEFEEQVVEGTGNKPVYNFQVCEDEFDDDLEYYSMKSIDLVNGNNDAIMVTPKINGKHLSMELDTGSALTIIPKGIYEQNFSDSEMQPSKVVFVTYTGHKLPCLGETKVQVALEGKVQWVKVHIVDVKGPALMGRDWLKSFTLNWSEIKRLKVLKHADIAPYDMNNEELKSAVDKLNVILEKYAEVFSDGMGKLKGTTAHLNLKEGASPKFKKPYPVAYAKRAAVDAEIDRLVKEGIIIPVESSEWATPVVPVEKGDGTVRLCGNFKCTVNEALKVETYPMPTIEDVFEKMAGGKYFTEIDLAHAYQQIEIDEVSQELLVINTHRGLFRNTRLLPGIAPASAIFQRNIDQVIVPVERTIAWIDNIVMSGRSVEEHLCQIEEILKRLKEKGLKAKAKKCQFFKTVIKALGYEISSVGINTCEDKIEAMINAPIPENRTQLRSFLGLVNYYRRFLKNLSTTLRPLDKLLSTKVLFKWDRECDKSFNEVKRMLVSTEVLTHFDPKKPVRVEADASKYGIGAVMSHVMDDGTHRPIAYASRTLNIHEQGYAQIDKEALSLVYAVEKFHQYLYGRSFTLVTDHKPLKYLLGPYTGIPHMAASRMQRWAIKMMKYQYEIEYRNTSTHANADALSRLPTANTKSTNIDAVTVFAMNQIKELPVTADDIKKWTDKDQLLSLIKDILLNGHDSESIYQDNMNLKPYLNNIHEFSIEQGCIMRGNRIVIPEQLRKVVLDELHEGHCGMVAMKGIARSYIWWPGIDSDIELMVKSCQDCKMVQNNPAKSPLHLWEWPSGKWQRIHIDYAGPIRGLMFLVVVDAYSKWPEVIVRQSTTSKSTINALRTLFAQHGLPQVIVSDNATNFVSEEFTQFCENNGIKHNRTEPYFPQKNGEAERFVQTLKRRLEKMSGDAGDVQEKLDRFLLCYRNTPHSATNETPAKLLKGQKLRSKLDLLKPDIRERVQNYQRKQMQRRGEGRHVDMEEGSNVLVRDYRAKRKWKEGIVQKRTGPFSYVVHTKEGLERKHQDQMRQDGGRENIEVGNAEVREVPKSPNVPYISRSQERNGLSSPTCPGTPNNSRASNGIVIGSPHGSPVLEGLMGSAPPTPSSSIITSIRKSDRVRKPPPRLINEI